YGDAPYTDALKADKGGDQYTFPKFDSQQSIYDSVLANLEKANALLSETSFNSSTGAADIFYGGDAGKWRKFANSLALRYYMRLSEKLPELAKQGIEKIAGDPVKYPVITAVTDEPAMAFPGNSDMDSWPAYAVPQSDSTNYIRIKMCNTLVKTLLEKNDPRITAWAEPVTESIYVDPDLSGNISKVVYDTIINGVRRPRVLIITDEYLSAKGITVNDINQDPFYVGLP